MKLSILDRKLLRDLWSTRGQAAAIALVIAAGVALFVLMLTNLISLELTQETYYQRFRFAEVFATAKRAPLSLQPRIAEIPGVARADTRVVMNVLLDVPGMREPAVGRLVSVPAANRPLLCDVFLRAGRYLEPNRPDEVLVSETFADAHGFGPGDELVAVINGRRRALRIVGLALSPEYVYQVRPGELFPDPARFAIIWMERRALATAFQMDGAFNDVVLTLAPGASEPEVIARLDRLLEPYGGLGAYPRSLQLSHWYLQNELDQLSGMGMILPIIFLGVAAFLLNVTLTRIVGVQREQIAAMKALGRSNLELALHYLKWALAVAAVGAAVGIAAGAWLGRHMAELYADFFHFPILLYRMPASVVFQGLLVSFAAAAAGAMVAVRRAVTLPPAEAMRPEPPASYRESLLERAGLKGAFSQPGRMILRNIQRHPGRTAVSVGGIAMAAALLVVGTFTIDAVDELMDLQFHSAQRYDVLVSFVEPRSAAAFHEVTRLPGVLRAEPFRNVPARLRVGHRSRQTAISGLPAEPALQRVVSIDFTPVALPPGGLVLSQALAELLEVRVGGNVRVEVLEGRRPTLDVPVVAVVEEYLGLNAYMEQDTLHRLMREQGALSGAALLVEPGRVNDLYRTLKDTPAVAGVLLKRAAIESFEQTMAENIGIIRGFNILFATIICFGVVYNAARISLSERSRELATLRVIGFTRGEISYILLGELALVTLLAIPLGLVIGYLLAAALTVAMATELFRIPLVVLPRTYAFAAITVLVAAALSGLVVRRRLDQLNLVEVLKTRE